LYRRGGFYARRFRSRGFGMSLPDCDRIGYVTFAVGCEVYMVICG
jgi:hypothetical protein